ncbi:RdgB/HAM1 family non-canonical purine NTP pyrophosphatase [Crocinitomicaceae bacterium]|jgi:XTP/dITP diphosphohydrolase|nr:RdgB/HAM1 family non-canonical purine NTP pyrophosphatase [Crocinitomicaceae bacterium]
MKLIFASHNENKVAEIQSLLGEDFSLLSLKELSFNQDIPETSETLEGNSIIKADAVFEQFKMPCFADDTGLEVDSLGGEPGVYSARYGGEDKNADKNMDLLLKKLHGISSRKARFRTVITYRTQNQMHQFEGVVEGNIINEKKGVHGFGYDPIFIPIGSQKTFAQMSTKEKNQFSHRSRAFEKLRIFLRQG